MTEIRMNRFTGFVLGAVVLVVVVVVVVLVATLPHRNADPICPYDKPPLVLVSLDGFRPEYLERGITPTLNSLKQEGVSPPYMKPSYPSLTFPNHYTIVTGLYPESHGIIANKFYDPEFKATFSMGSDEALLGRWWGGEPIWNTLTRQGKLSATYFWVGSEADIGGQHPTYWFPYSDLTPFTERVDQVLEWLQLPVIDRPSWISIYLNEPDHTGHGEGPFSNQENALIMYVDSMIELLLNELEDHGLTECVDLMIVSDHGMAQAGAEKVIKLKDYIPDIYDLGFTYSGAFPRISLKEESEEIELAMLQNLTCQRDEMRSYDAHDLPTRFHFSNNRRIEDIVLDLDPGFTASVSSDWYLEGQHGYDNYFEDMNALFIARGPSFKKGLVVEPFQNIELYNLMCLLTSVEPAPNNGTEGSLYHLLQYPPEVPQLPEEDKPTVSSYPSAEEVDGRLGLSGCPGDLDAVEPWLSGLDLSPGEQSEAEATHLPWGIPHSGELPASLTLLYHTTHVTAYSKELKMPLWTSFAVTETQATTEPAEWSSDVRLTANTTITCADYESVSDLNVSMRPLFPPGYISDLSLTRVGYVVSNAVPMSSGLSGRWGHLVEQLVPQWLERYGSLNLLLGPVFDLDADSHVDNFTMFGSPPQVPSDMFAVVTRCKASVGIQDCPPKEIDAAAFIFPELPKASNCLNETRYAQMFSARVRDVEMATGLTLYPELSFTDRTRLTLRIHSDIWPTE